MTNIFLLDKSLIQVSENGDGYYYEGICLLTYAAWKSSVFNDYGECLIAARKRAILRKVQISNYPAILTDQNDQIIAANLIAKEAFEDAKEGSQISAIKGNWLLCPMGSEFRVFTAFESAGEGEGL